MLTQRQELILQAIVRQFTVTGQPVGSKLLAEVLPFKVSSATIRNEMVVLEHEGLVKKEHSSSGRVPSKQGYRYYVDHLLDPAIISATDSAMIHNSLGTEFQKIDEIVSHNKRCMEQEEAWRKAWSDWQDSIFVHSFQEDVNGQLSRIFDAVFECIKQVNGEIFNIKQIAEKEEESNANELEQLIERRKNDYK